MGINVTITADSAEELRVLLNGFNAIVTEGKITGASVTASAPAPAEGAAGKRQRKPADAPATEAPPADPEQQTLGVTLKDLQDKLRALAKAGKSAEVKELLLEFGDGTIGGLPEDKVEEAFAAADLL